MYITSALVALTGFGSLVASAPARVQGGVVDRHIVEARGAVKADTSPAQLHNKRSTVIIQQTVVQPQVTVVEENLDLVNQLALAAEQEFSALVQAQLALVQEVETIKNNIRVNHFLAKFSQVNTVIVSVTQVVDLRNGAGSRNTRYMVNQQLADNKKSQSTVVVMVSAASAVTINAAAPTLNLNGILSNSTAASGVVSAAAVSTAAASASASNSSSNASTAQVSGFDSANPFGQIGQTIILPYGSKAPSLPNGAQLFADPASIILPNQANLIVEDITQFNQDCQLYTSNSLSLFNLESAIIQQAAQVAALELSGLSLGSAGALNSAAAAGLVGSAVVSSSSTAASTTTTAAAVSVAAATVSTSAAATASAAVAVGAAVVSASTPAAAAAAAPAATSAGVGVQIVPVPAA